METLEEKPIQMIQNKELLESLREAFRLVLQPTATHPQSMRLSIAGLLYSK